MSAFKKKLQKDLRWLKYWWFKVIVSIVLGFLITVSIGFFINLAPDGMEVLVFTIVLSFIPVYLFSAWLYAEEELEEQKDD